MIRFVKWISVELKIKIQLLSRSKQIKTNHDIKQKLFINPDYSRLFVSIAKGSLCLRHPTMFTNFKVDKQLIRSTKKKLL